MTQSNKFCWVLAPPGLLMVLGYIMLSIANTIAEVGSKVSNIGIAFVVGFEVSLDFDHS
jgi:hypothetical protein